MRRRILHSLAWCLERMALRLRFMAAEPFDAARFSLELTDAEWEDWDRAMQDS